MDHHSFSRIDWRWSPARVISSFWVMGFLVFVSLNLTDARAENGRDFSGMYVIGPATVFDSTHVSVTLFLRLQNHSGADLSNAAVFLMNRLQPGKAGTPFASGISAPYRGVAKASGVVAVNTEEYQRWQHGGHPELVVRVLDQRGRKVDRPIELLRMPRAGAMP
jgi:hypothetical protein